MHNVDLLFREDISVDELIDVIQGNRKYVRCLYVYNKIDTITIEDVDQLARQPDSIVISVHLRLNFDYFLEKMWEFMGLIRVYTKRKGAPPDLDDPVVLSSQRDGISVESATTAVSRELITVFNFAYVWGTSAKHSPQRVGLAHVLEDEDVIQIVSKTVKQDRNSKGYGERVQAYNSMVAEKRKACGEVKTKESPDVKLKKQKVQQLSPEESAAKLQDLIAEAKGDEADALECISEAADAKEVEALRVAFLGKNGKIMGMMKDMYTNGDD